MDLIADRGRLFHFALVARQSLEWDNTTAVSRNPKLRNDRDQTQKPGEMGMSVRSIVLDQIVRVARQQNKTLVPLSDGLPLLNSGLDSLCIAILVASLEDAIGVDPFDDDDDVPFPVTLGNLIELYENATI